MVEHRAVRDDLGLMQPLGIIPAPQTHGDPCSRTFELELPKEPLHMLADQHRIVDIKRRKKHG